MMKRTTVLAFLPLVILLFVPVSLAQDMIRMKPGNGPILTQQPGKAQVQNARIVQLPDLVVESIWLDTSCVINIKLRNAGGPIPDAEHQTSQVKVQAQSLLNYLPLMVLDPTGVLKKSGGQASCNTRIQLKAAGEVRVMADYNKRIKETGTGENNNELASQQTPQCSAQTKTLKNDARPSLTDPASKGTTMKLTPGSALPPSPKGTNTESAPFSISVLSPTKGSSWIIGNQLQVRWTAVPLTKPFHVFLLKKPKDKTAAAIIAQFKTFKPDQYGIFTEDWIIPSYVTPGEYVIKIIYIDDPSIFSVSEPFKLKDHGLNLTTYQATFVGPKVETFRIFRPDATDTALRGKPFLIAWEYLPAVLKDQGLYNTVQNQVRIMLKNEKGQDKLTISTSAPNNHPIYDQGPIPNSGSSFTWIVDGIPDGHYVARVETVDGRFYGESKPFIVWTPSVFQMQKKGGTTALEAANDQLEKFPAKQKGTPVEVSFKLISATPGATQMGRMDKLELVVEVNSNTDFKFGDDLMDPKVGHVTVKAYLILDLKWNEPGKTFNSMAAFGNSGVRIFEYNDYFPSSSYPAGVFKKGKNTVKFIFKDFSPSHFKALPNINVLGPIKATWDDIHYTGGGGYYIKSPACFAEQDLYGFVRMALITQKQGGGIYEGNLYFAVRQPRLIVNDVLMPLPCH